MIQVLISYLNIDINMLSKMSSIMWEKMNNSKDDPRKNLLKSLRPLSS